jgi:hypothetical protein
MNNKWYISALVIILAFLGGVATQEQNQIPNQEIVLQFSDASVTDREAQLAIAAVKEQLQAIGVHDIKVTDFEQGYLKITYFSRKDVASIKKILSEGVTLQMSDDVPIEFPSNTNEIAYNLEVYEIQNEFNHAFHLSGKLGVEQKADNDRLSITNTFANSKINEYTVLELKTNVAYRFQNHIGITIDHITHKIPEVRAGPFTSGIIEIS